MSLEENKAIVRRLYDAFNKHNWDLLDDLVAPEYFDHTRQLRGLETLKQQMKLGRLAFSDYHETIEDIIAEGDKVWVLITYTAAHTGDFFGLAPTGNKLAAPGVDIHRIVDGKVLEYWNVTNTLDWFIQLGVIEYTEKGKEFFRQFLPEDVK
jgi:predicted ester cyclase